MNIMDLKFSVLMAQALSEWARHLNFQLSRASKDMNNYSVKGLGIMADNMADTHPAIEMGAKTGLLQPVSCFRLIV